MINPEQPNYSNTPVSANRPRFAYQPEAHGLAPAVSVITPYYNTDESFLETAQSLLAQSFQDWEWIIVDDGSTDRYSLDRLASVQAGDPRIKVITQANSGPAAARNHAFRHSMGRYVCLLDSDDMLEPTFIEKCLWFLESEPNFAFVNAWTVNFGEKEFLWAIGFERGVAHLEANSGPPIALVRRDAYIAAGGFDESIRIGHEDWDFWLRLANAGLWGYTLPEYLAWYRNRQGGRFFQFMQNTSAHERFATTLAAKYRGLRDRFPSPRLKEPIPYETPPYDLPFRNRLRKPESVRHALFLVPWMVTGGADKVNLDWMAGLIRQGFRVTVCATLKTRQTWLHKFEELSPDVFVLPNFLRIPEFPRFLTYLIHSRQIDTVIIAGSTLGYHFLPYLRSRCPNATFVDITHVVEPHWLNGGHPRFSVGYQQLLDMNIVTTMALRSWMVDRGADASRIAVCYTGVDADAANPARFDKTAIRGKYGLAEGVPVVVFAGRLCAQKRPLLVCDILAHVRDLGVDFQALIIGDGELRDQVEARLRELGLHSRVILPGAVAHDAWIEALAVSDILLLPSEYEGISVALYESMAMEVVPVTAEVGGQPEIVHATCGVLIGAGDRELDRYAQALTDLLRDPARRQQLGKAARSRILGGFTDVQGVVAFSNSLESARINAKQFPRALVAPGVGQELATFAIEYARISSATDFLWGHWLTTSNQHASESSPLLPAAVKLLALLLDTGIGRSLTRNRFVHRLGSWLIRFLERKRLPLAVEKR